MQRLFLQRVLDSRRWSSSNAARGLREQFTEYEVRWRFNRWRNSLWLAPNPWVNDTRDRSIRITRRWLPFWSLSLEGSIQSSLSTKSNSPFRHDETYYSQRQWHSFPLPLEKISLSNVNIYAAESLDRYHVQRLDVSFDDLPLTELSKEMVTLDETTAFHHAWILIIKPLLENLCLEEAKKIYPTFDDPRIDSFHLKIRAKESRLLYYPVYMINYNYRSQSNYTCLFDGITGLITGDRQYSPVKVTVAALTAVYPMLTIGVFSISSMVDLLFAFELASALSFTVSLPLALIVAPCLGFYARSYPQLYRKELSEVQWKQDQSKVTRFTYELPVL